MNPMFEAWMSQRQPWQQRPWQRQWQQQPWQLHPWQQQQQPGLMGTGNDANGNPVGYNNPIGYLAPQLPPGLNQAWNKSGAGF